MKAIVWTKYGSPDVLQLREVERPSPGDDELLIRIHATTVTAGDCEMRGLKIPLLLRLPMRAYVGMDRPRRLTILGQELAGEVEAVGERVSRFQVGDPVFAATGFRLRAYAEYICLPEASADVVVAAKPANLSYEQAAAVPVGGLEALHFLRRGNIRSGQRVIIIGAGGSIGTIAVQLARHYGAIVTAVDSTAKLDMLRRIGAANVIDYTREDFTELGAIYDVVFDVVGKSSFSRSMSVLKPDGRYLLGNAGLARTIRARWTSQTSGVTVVTGTASFKTEDLVFLKELVEAGEITPVVDRTYPLERTAEAHRFVESGQKQGNVVISVVHEA